MGQLNSLAYYSLAIAGPDANRINVLDATNTSLAGLPASVFIPSLGPNLVVAMDIGGPTNTPLADLYVASLYNGTNAFRDTLIRNHGGTNQTVLADKPTLYQQQRGNPVLLNTNQPPGLSLFQRNVSPGVDYLTLFNLSAGTAFEPDQHCHGANPPAFRLCERPVREHQPLYPVPGVSAHRRLFLRVPGHRTVARRV